MSPPFLRLYYSDYHLHRNQFNVFLSLLTYFKKGLKLSAVVSRADAVRGHMIILIGMVHPGQKALKSFMMLV